MKRDLTLLANKKYDLVIIGGGIFGVCAAWDAVSRGLSVALVEKKDFAHSTSANSFRMIHGGIRYMQHLDLFRVRRAVKERRALLRIAPHLTYPLPIIIPVYGHGMKGNEALRLAFFAYDIVSIDRNIGISDPERQIPRGYFISRSEAIKMIPGLNKEGLSGAAVFYDGQMYNQSRLALSFLISAVNAGVEAANYLEVAGFIKDGNRMLGVKALDVLTGNHLEVYGDIVLNAAGPWAEQLLENHTEMHLNPRGTYSRDLCFIVKKRLTDKFAVAVQGRTRDSDALLSREKRHLFVVPWQNYTLVGVWHVVHNGGPDDFVVTHEELKSYIKEINEAYSGLSLNDDDVLMWNAGLVLFGGNAQGSTGLSFGKQSRIIDHAKEHGFDGVISLIGARYSTARGDASTAIDLVFNKLSRQPPKSFTDVMPIYGGRIDNFGEFIQKAKDQCPPRLSSEVMHSLVHNHGSEYGRILKYVQEAPALAETLDRSHVIIAEVLHAIREEMAMKLGDVVFRRTDLGSGEYPGDETLKTCAALMASELGWTKAKEENELNEVMNRFVTICPSLNSEHIVGRT